MLPYTTPPRTTKPSICHHFRKCGMNSLVAEMSISGPGQNKEKKERKKKRNYHSESINKTCWLGLFLFFHQLLCYAHLAFKKMRNTNVKKWRKESTDPSLTNRTVSMGWIWVTSITANPTYKGAESKVCCVNPAQYEFRPSMKTYNIVFVVLSINLSGWKPVDIACLHRTMELFALISQDSIFDSSHDSEWQNHQRRANSGLKTLPLAT